jgi:hypothetical protein
VEILAKATVALSDQFNSMNQGPKKMQAGVPTGLRRISGAMPDGYYFFAAFANG